MCHLVQQTVESNTPTQKGWVKNVPSINCDTPSSVGVCQKVNCDTPLWSQGLFLNDRHAGLRESNHRNRVTQGDQTVNTVCCSSFEPSGETFHLINA